MTTFFRASLLSLFLITAIGCDSSTGEDASGPGIVLPETTESFEGCGPYAPVCGADGLTYSSACEAVGLGVEIDTFSPCDCGPTLQSHAISGAIQGTWGAVEKWRIRLDIQGNTITRIDYLDECAAGTGCPGGGVAVSYGTLNLSGPLVHVVWNQPTINPMVFLPPLYIYESYCNDGDIYLVEMAMMHDIFFGKQP